jgi:predicted RNA-binding protein YlxR (DUF448 family)
VPTRGHEPERTCLGCGARERKAQLVRLIVNAAGQLEIAGQGQRGGYLHQRAECWNKFVGRKSHFRAFRVEVAKPVKEKLVRDLKDRVGT